MHQIQHSVAKARLAVSPSSLFSSLPLPLSALLCSSVLQRASTASGTEGNDAADKVDDQCVLLQLLITR